MRKKKNILHIMFTTILVVMFFYSAYRIVIWKLDNHKSEKTMNVIKEDIKIVTNKITKKEEYQIDFENLKKKNEDTVAFIKVNGTNIEYPVVKTDDNSYYLTHSFDKTVNGAGWPFANYLNRFDGTDKNITIFAHSRYDGSMFGTLYKTLNVDWQSNLENQKILFITENGTNFYQVFSTYQVLNEDYYIQTDFSSLDEYGEFLSIISARSNYDYHIEVTTDDTILTLSSCSSDDRYRIVLHAKRV